VPAANAETRPAGRGFWLAAQLAILLGALAAGLWPGAIHPSSLRPAPLPLLHAVAAGLVVCMLTVTPLSAAGRACRAAPIRKPLAELTVVVVFSTPAGVVGLWLGDLPGLALGRVGLYLLTLLPLSSAGAGWMARRRGGGWVLTALLGVVLALPGAWYVGADFFLGTDATWLWHLAPMTRIWQLAGDRGSQLLAGPAWAWLVWPAVGLAGLAGLGLVPGRNGEQA
jgi:hypothetical protein